MRMLCLSGPWSLDMHTWQLGQCSYTESCSSVMVRWVASSGHVADDHGFNLEAEILHSCVCVVLCVLL